MTHNPTILRKTLPLYKEVHFIWRGHAEITSLSLQIYLSRAFADPGGQ
jgi:hypothetical protein